MKTREEVEAIALEMHSEPNGTLKKVHFSLNFFRRKLREAFIEGYLLSQEQDNWISVSERLPTINPNGFSDRVLTTNNGELVMINSYDKEFNRFDRPYYQDKVTHWQPLPPKPKQ